MNIIELYNINNNIDVRTNLISLKDKLSKELSLTDLKQDINYNTEIFAKLLFDEDSKVRKNAALIIGMIDEPGLVKNLYESYEKENTLFVRSAYLRSLRKYDFSAYKDSLTERLNNLKKAEYEQSELKHIAEELQELKTMVGIKGEREAVSFRNPKEPVLIFLTCKKEMADILAEQVKEMTGLVTKKVFCGVALKTADIGKVSCIRTYKELLFPLNGLTAYDGADVIREIIKGDLFKLLDSMHDKKDAVYNFRVSGNIDAMKFGREIETASYGRLVNSVSDYDIELRFIQNKESKSCRRQHSAQCRRCNGRGMMNLSCMLHQIPRCCGKSTNTAVARRRSYNIITHVFSSGCSLFQSSRKQQALTFLMRLCKAIAIRNLQQLHPCRLQGLLDFFYAVGSFVVVFLHTLI